MGDWKDTLEFLRARMTANATAKLGVKMTDAPIKKFAAMTKMEIFSIGRDLEAALIDTGELGAKGKPIYRYKDGVSDATLAVKHNRPESTIMSMRQDMFGRLKRVDTGGNHYTAKLDATQADVQRISEQLAEFARRLEALENAVTTPERKVISITQNGNGQHKDLF